MSVKNKKEKSLFEQKLESKLTGGKFRIMNEKMYKGESMSETEMKNYHKYYNNQIKKWPADPHKMIIKEIQEILNVEKEKVLKVADLGCGDHQKFSGIKKVEFYFYDKYPSDKKVIRADLEKIPIEDSFFDISVCCLSLMNSDISKFVIEINRIIKKEGIFLLAEVRSRINSLRVFASKVEKYGFKVENVNSSNKYFTVFKFSKTRNLETSEKLPPLKLKTCQYKKQ